MFCVFRCFQNELDGYCSLEVFRFTNRFKSNRFTSFSPGDRNWDEGLR